MPNQTPQPDCFADIFEGSNLSDMADLFALDAQEQTLRAEQPERFEAVLSILKRHDPASLATERADYAPEVGTILPLLGDCRCTADFAALLHSQFKWWGLPVKEEAISAIASELAILIY